MAAPLGPRSRPARVWMELLGPPARQLVAAGGRRPAPPPLVRRRPPPAAVEPRRVRVCRRLVAAALAAAALPAPAPGAAARPPPPPPPLPPPPAAATLAAVLPYLGRLALGERHLYWRLAAAAALLALSKAAGLAAPFYFKAAVDALAAGGARRASAAAAAAALAVAGAARVLGAVAKEAQHPVFTPVAQAAGRRASYAALAHVLGLDLQFHLDRSTGALSRMLERGARAVAMVFRAVVFTFVPTLVELAAVCAILARSFGGRVAALVVATFVVYGGVTVALTLAATRARREVKDLDNAITGRAVDALLNVETVMLCGAAGAEAAAYDGTLVAYQAAAVRLEALSAALNAAQAGVLGAGMAAALVAAAAAPGATPGDLVMVQGLLLQVWAPLQFLGWFYRELRQALVDLEDLFALLARPPAVADGADDLPAAGGGGAGAGPENGAEQQQPRGLAVELRGVRFAYPGTGGREVLRGVDIRAAPGESVGVVGPSGSGKSTLLRLLVRLYDPGAGAVLLDGADARTLRQASLRAAIAVVPQDTALFNDTIRHNIAYGRPGASDAEVEAAAAAARLGGAIARLPAGWDTIVGERGLKLSGGEKQRVAIARAALRAPRLLICDEATSALDARTEAGVMEDLQALAAGRTSFFVAHRLATVRRCDRIVVLVDGRVAEEGTHEALLKKEGGVYAEMWDMQARAQVASRHLRELGGALSNGGGGGLSDGEGLGGRGAPAAVVSSDEEAGPVETL